MWQKYALIALAGAAGTLARYGLSGLVQRLGGIAFPWGTWTVNLVGCFAFGVIWSLAEDRVLISGETRFIVLTGFMGAFTTFSTFAFETAEMLHEGSWLLAAGNVLGQNLLGIAGVLLGLAVSRLL